MAGEVRWETRRHIFGKVKIIAPTPLRKSALPANAMKADLAWQVKSPAGCSQMPKFRTGLTASTSTRMKSVQVGDRVPLGHLSTSVER